MIIMRVKKRKQQNLFEIKIKPISVRVFRIFERTVRGLPNDHMVFRDHVPFTARDGVQTTTDKRYCIKRRLARNTSSS